MRIEPDLAPVLNGLNRTLNVVWASAERFAGSAGFPSMRNSPLELAMLVTVRPSSPVFRIVTVFASEGALTIWSAKESALGLTAISGGANR